MSLPTRSGRNSGDAPSQFKDISDECVFQDIEVVLSEPDLNTQQKNELKAIANGCLNVLEKLEQTLDKYSELKSGSGSVGSRCICLCQRLPTHAFPARLRSLKHYFFLDRSDFFSYFLELGASELRKPVKVVNTSKLQSLLDLVLRQPGSVAAQDSFKEDVKVEMNEINLTNFLTRVVNISGSSTTGTEQGETLQTPASQLTNENDKHVVDYSRNME
ncbi:hypothetical protein V8E54_007853 [Elaphomyces granulatus]